MQAELPFRGFKGLNYLGVTDVAEHVVAKAVATTAVVSPVVLQALKQNAAAKCKRLHVKPSCAATAPARSTYLSPDRQG
jgi:hypothetical protein